MSIADDAKKLAEQKFCDEQVKRDAAAKRLETQLRAAQMRQIKRARKWAVPILNDKLGYRVCWVIDVPDTYVGQDNPAADVIIDSDGRSHPSRLTVNKLGQIFGYFYRYNSYNRQAYSVKIEVNNLEHLGELLLSSQQALWNERDNAPMGMTD